MTKITNTIFLNNSLGIYSSSNQNNISYPVVFVPNDRISAITQKSSNELIKKYDKAWKDLANQ